MVGLVDVIKRLFLIKPLKEMDLPIFAILSDKQKGLAEAVKELF